MKQPILRWSQTHLFTLKEAPSDAEIPSHKLMMRSGFMKKLGPGLYSYGAIGLRAIRKFEEIVRENYTQQAESKSLCQWYNLENYGKKLTAGLKWAQAY